MKMATILFIVTSHGMLGDTKEPSGLWLEEVATPYYAFVDAGYEVEIASIAGGKAPVDPRSQKPVGENSASVDRFLKDQVAVKKLNNTLPIDKLQQPYDVVFLPGGHGTMWDFPTSTTLANIIGSTLDDGRIVAAVCHGPAGLVSAKLKNGDSVVKGKQISAFTNDEEEAVGLTKTVPFLLESKMKELGANYVKAPNFQSFAVADGNLITGQNPASSGKVAELVIEELKKRGAL